MESADIGDALGRIGEWIGDHWMAGAVLAALALSLAAFLTARTALDLAAFRR